jgi:hypothetical protein
VSDKKERYQIMHYGRTIQAQLVRATAEKPSQAYNGAKWLEKEGAPDVRIHDTVTGKVYDLKSFGKEHKLA